MSRLLSVVARFVALLIVVIAALAIPFAYVIRQMAKPPANNPQKFLKLGGRKSLAPDQPLVVCLGASIVHGRVCPNFVDLAAKRQPSHAFVNAGVGGDTSYHALQRLDQVIACDPDYVVILVGTNDIICTLIPDQWRMYRGEKRLSSSPTLESYQANLREILQRLQSRTRARVAVCSLPLLGEDLNAAGNERVREFNAAIKQLCDEQQATYLPVHEQETDYLVQHHGEHGRPFQAEEKRIIQYTLLGTLRHYLMGQSWDEIARRRGMLLKTDLIHGNSIEAGIIADNLVAFLEKRAEKHSSQDYS